jgi:hypothetical protein
VADNILRLDSRRDVEAIAWAKEARETHSLAPQFALSRYRPSAAEVVSLRAICRQADRTIATQPALKSVFVPGQKQEITDGPYSLTGAVCAVMRWSARPTTGAQRPVARDRGALD